MLDLSTLPALPPGKPWPQWMLSDTPMAARLRESYARIANAVAFDQAEEAEKRRALAWCRANGNPHQHCAGNGQKHGG